MCSFGSKNEKRERKKSQQLGPTHSHTHVRIQIKRNAVNNIKEKKEKKVQELWTLDQAVTNEVRNVGVLNIHMHGI